MCAAEACCRVLSCTLRCLLPPSFPARHPRPHVPPPACPGCRGRPLDELWRVARGEVKYADYIQEWGRLLAPDVEQRQRAAPPPPKQQKKQQRQQEQKQEQEQQSGYVPDDLVGVQAYILWEQAGKPDGADFGGEARQLLEGRLRGGESLDDIERSLRGPQPEPAQQQRQQKSAPVAEPAAKQPAVVGQSMGMKSRNPLDMINRSSAPLLSEKKRAVRSPLTPLLEATHDDPNTTWHRVGRTTGVAPLKQARHGTKTVHAGRLPTQRAAYWRL